MSNWSLCFCSKIWKIRNSLIYWKFKKFESKVVVSDQYSAFFLFSGQLLKLIYFIIPSVWIIIIFQRVGREKKEFAIDCKLMLMWHLMQIYREICCFRRKMRNLVDFTCSCEIFDTTAIQSWNSLVISEKNINIR